MCVSHKHGFMYTNAQYTQKVPQNATFCYYYPLFFIFNERHAAIRDFSHHCILFILYTTVDDVRRSVYKTKNREYV